MIKRLMYITLIGMLIMSCASKSKIQATQVSGVNLKWVGVPDNQFKENLELAFKRLNVFLEDEGLSQKPVQKLIDEVIHFESKKLFDSEIKRLTNGQMKTVPKTYVAVGDDGILRTISLDAYLKVHPEHSIKDFVNILVHEAAHIFHSKTYGNDGMGPVWFFEGFAIVAADQYVDEVTLSKSEMRSIAVAKERGNYKEYGFMVRELQKSHSLVGMLQKAKDSPNEFTRYLGL